MNVKSTFVPDFHVETQGHNWFSNQKLVLKLPEPQISKSDWWPLRLTYDSSILYDLCPYGRDVFEDQYYGVNTFSYSVVSSEWPGQSKFIQLSCSYEYPEN